MRKVKKTLCVLLSLIMIMGVLAVAPITVSAGMPFYFHAGVAADENYNYWYAWTWSDSEDGYWLKGSETADGIEFFGLSDKVTFVLMYSDYDQEELDENVWEDAMYQSDDLDVDFEHNHFTATKWTDYNDKLGSDNFNGVWADAETPLIKANTMTVSTSVKTVKASKLKKSDVTVKPLAISKAKGAVTVTKEKSGTSSKIYSKVSVANTKTGELKLKKGSYKAGTYNIKLKITAAGNSAYKKKAVSKTVKIKIKGKSANPIEITTKFKDVKISALQKSGKTYKLISAKKAKGKVVFKKVKKGTTASIFKSVKVNKKNGAVTVKKGTYSKGVYEVKIKVTAKGNDDYKSKSVNATVKLRIANKFTQCKTCEGKGYVYTGVTVYNYVMGMYAGATRLTRDCTDCEGTGKVVS